MRVPNPMSAPTPMIARSPICARPTDRGKGQGKALPGEMYAPSPTTAEAGTSTVVPSGLVYLLMCPPGGRSLIASGSRPDTERDFHRDYSTTKARRWLSIDQDLKRLRRLCPRSNGPSIADGVPVISWNNLGVVKGIGTGILRANHRSNDRE